MSEEVLYHETCRVCETQLDPILSLGPLHISSFLAPLEEPSHPKVPLELTRCPHCTLVQLRHTTPPEWLYGPSQYWYRSGINETMRAELADVVEAACRVVSLAPYDQVLDIGANDGTLLACYPPKIIRTAFEPSQNLLKELRQHAELVIPLPFPPPFFKRDWEGRFQVVTSVAVFYDLEDPKKFCEAIKFLLAKEGVWIIQLQDLAGMLTSVAFDNINAEHLEYYSLVSLVYLLAPFGLQVVRVEPRAINGGSLRVFVAHVGSTLAHEIDPGYFGEQLHIEEKLGLLLQSDPDLTQETFTRFAGKIQTVKTQLRSLLVRAKAQGLVVDLYAASTKSSTLLQYCDITATLIRQAVERSPEKVGRRTIGTNIPIVSEEMMRTNPPDLAVVGAYQFKDAFIEREADFLAKGGKFLFPLPYTELVLEVQDVAQTMDDDAPRVYGVWADGHGRADAVANAIGGDLSSDSRGPLLEADYPASPRGDSEAPAGGQPTEVSQAERPLGDGGGD